MKLNEQNYVDEAEKVILNPKNLKKKNGKLVPAITISQLRNLLAMTADIYNQILNQHGERLSEDVCSRIQYLRIRFLYEAGRNKDVKNLIETAELINIVQEIAGSREKYILFSRYMEALVAFHRYHGGADI